jgi:hypothetical protein
MQNAPEANTLGSKSVDAELSQASLELKVLIEQMREQVQNLNSFGDLKNPGIVLTPCLLKVVSRAFH